MKAYVKMSQVVVLGCGAFARYSRHEGRALMNGLALKETPYSSLCPSTTRTEIFSECCNGLVLLVTALN